MVCFLGSCKQHVPALISISGILSPVGVGVHLAGRNGEEAFVYVGHACGIGCDFPTGAVLEYACFAILNKINPNANFCAK